MHTVARGDQLQLIFELYSATIQQLTDPDEDPDGPRLTITPVAGGDPVYSDVPAARHLAVGKYAFVVGLTDDESVLPDGEYVAEITNASKAGVDLVDATGQPPTSHFVLLDAALAVAPDRFYMEPIDLSRTWNVDPVPTEAEVRAAQFQLDAWMHRSLWPTVYAPPPFRLRGSNVFTLPHKPLIKLLTLEGGYIPGRRHQRWVDPVGDPSFLGLRGWTPIPLEQAQVTLGSGHVWIPSGTLGGVFTQVRTSYLAGYTAIDRDATLAVAQTVAWQRFKGFSDLERFSSGQVSREMGKSLVPSSAMDICEKWRVKAYR